MKRPVNDIPAEPISLALISVEGKAPGKKEVDTLVEEIEISGGMLYPIIVAKNPPNGKEHSYRLKHGRKRYEAAKRLGWKEVKCVVIPPFEAENSDTIVNKFADLADRLQRKELKDYDIAKAAVEMKDKYDIKGATFAVVLGLSQGYTYNLTRWYSSMPGEIRDAWKNEHPFISQAQLEHMSHMPKGEILNYFEKRQAMLAAPQMPFMPGKRTRAANAAARARRASEAQLLKLQEALDESPLTDSVKNLCSSIIKFALGASKDVPGITNYQKLPKELLSREALKESSTTVS